MTNLWTPLFSIAVFAVIFGIGDFISNKTKGLISTIVVGCLIYLIGFWTGIIPTNSLTSTNMPAMMSSFGIALMITNLGTMIDIEDLLREWKTVVIALVGLVGLAIGSFTIGIWLFGKVYSLAAASPISGGIIAGIITNEYAISANHPEIGGFAMLLVGFQMFIGMPITSYILKKEANQMLKSGNLSSNKVSRKKLVNIKCIPDMPKSLQTDTVYIAKLAIVAAIAAFIAQFTIIPGSKPVNYILNPNIAYLIFGILFTELGFLDKSSMSKANSMGILMLGLISILPGSLTTITPKVFVSMIYPIVGTLILATICISLFSIIMGKILGYSPRISIAIGLTAMVAYPGTQIITEEVVKGLNATDEEKQIIMDKLLPKMLVGGFVTVTIASVVFAGLVAPYIFK